MSCARKQQPLLAHDPRTARSEVQRTHQLGHRVPHFLRTQSQLNSRLSTHVNHVSMEINLKPALCTYVTDDVGYGISSVHFPSFTEHAQSHVHVCQRLLVRVVMGRFGQLLQENRNKIYIYIYKWVLFKEALSLIIIVMM